MRRFEYPSSHKGGNGAGGNGNHGYHVGADRVAKIDTEQKSQSKCNDHADSETGQCTQKASVPEIRKTTDANLRTVMAGICSFRA